MRQEVNPDAIEVAIDEGVLAVKVNNKPLENVLRVIAERVGLRMTLSGDLGPPVTAWFELPLEEALRSLVGRNSLIMIYDTAPGQAGRPLWTSIRMSGVPNGSIVTIEPTHEKRSLDQVYASLERLDRENKLRAVRELFDLDDGAAINDLALVLGKEADTKVRRAAAVGLGRSRNQEAVSALTTALKDANRSIQFQAIHGLAQIGGQDATEALTGILADDNDLVRLQAVLALNRIGDAGAMEALTTVIEGDKDADVRRIAVRTLAKLGGDEAWYVLFDAMHDPARKVREAAAASIRLK